MAFCSKKNESGDDGYVVIEKAFITHFLPFAELNAIKVYLFGLKLTDELSPNENSLENIAVSLNLTVDEVVEAFEFWKKYGLVELYGNPLTVRYISPKKAFLPPKLYDKSKYAEFNEQMQELYPTHMLSPNEYESMYQVIESYKVEPMNFALIAKYCVELKGEVAVRYLLKVAESWFVEGITDMPKIEERIKEQETYGENIRAVFAALGRKSSPEFEDRELFLKWTKSWGFGLKAILVACKKAKTMARLDSELDKFFRMDCFTEEEIESYYAERKKLFNTAYEINKKLSLNYASVDNIVDTYIVPWQNKGFDSETLVTVAQYCFLMNKRSLEYMGNLINSFYKEGCISLQSINEKIAGLLSEGVFISRFLELTGATRAVTPRDREALHVWQDEWGFEEDMIIKAAELSIGATYPVAKIGKILAAWKKAGIAKAEDVPEDMPQIYAPKKKVRNYKEREYTAEELKSVFRGFEEEDE